MLRVRYIGMQFGLVVLATSLLFIAGCGSSESDDGRSSDAKPKVALIMKSLANEFFVTMANAAEVHQEQHQDAYELIVNGIKNESDLAQQVALVDQMIGIDVDAIVIAPADSKALVPALARARENGIHVVNIDNRLDRDVLAEYDLVIPFIGPDNRKGARDAANFALEQLPEGANVVILEGVTTAQNAIDRRMGFEDAVAANGANLVTKQSALWDQTKAAEVTAAILVRHPDVHLILAANDNMALGAASAVSFADLASNVSIVGFDNISAVHPLLLEGRVLATVEQYGDQFAVNGIELALDMINGQSELVDRETPLAVVSRADIEEPNAESTNQ